MEFLRLRLTQWGQIISEVFRAGFFFKNDSLNPLKFSMARETDTQKSQAILKNFDYFMIKLTKPPILPHGYSYIFIFFISLFTIAHLLSKANTLAISVSVSPMRENLRG